jgi:hypothetical protein
MRILTSMFLSLVVASSAYAQIDAFSLRSKYGLPLDRKPSRFDRGSKSGWTMDPRNKRAGS